MALKKLPGGVIVETDGGARLNEDAGVNLEAIHRQLGARIAVVEEGASGGDALPPGGTSGQTIVKQSDGSAAWADPTGMPGRGITSVVASTADPTTATVTYTDGTTAELTLPQGDTGPANVLSIGTVSTLPPGSKATASISGESPGQVLNLGLVEGPEGKASTVPGPPGAVATASSYILVGPGRPDTPSTTGGVITGSEPVGARYESTDEAGVGARTWRKVAGGKWIVTDGDTGVRNVALNSAVLSATTARIRRIGPNVTLTIRDFTSGSVGYPVASDLAGFKASQDMQNTPFVAFKDSDLTAVASFKIAQAMTPYLVNYKASGSISMSWTTADPWPTTLPGSPA